MPRSGSKREALLEAARQLGATATIDDLLKAAGAGTGTFYHHFPNGRADLVRELEATAAAGYDAALLRVLQRNRDAETGVKSVVHHHARWSLENPAADELLAVTLAPLRALNSAERLAGAAWAAVVELERAG